MHNQALKPWLAITWVIASSLWATTWTAVLVSFVFYFDELKTY